MYKYIGTEQQLLDLGFDKIGMYCYVLEDEISTTRFNIGHKNKEFIIDKYSNLGAVPNKMLKLFVEMVECGLIVWEE